MKGRDLVQEPLVVPRADRGRETEKAGVVERPPEEGNENQGEGVVFSWERNEKRTY